MTLGETGEDRIELMNVEELVERVHELLEASEPSMRTELASFRWEMFGEVVDRLVDAMSSGRDDTSELEDLRLFCREMQQSTETDDEGVDGIWRIFKHVYGRVNPRSFNPFN